MTEAMEHVSCYEVVVNHEEQYSIWPQGYDLPAGWSSVDYAGSRFECLTFINNIWSDMRPLSLRRQLGESKVAAE